MKRRRPCLADVSFEPTNLIQKGNNFTARGADVSKSHQRNVRLVKSLVLWGGGKFHPLDRSFISRINSSGVNVQINAFHRRNEKCFALQSNWNNDRRSKTRNVALTDWSNYRRTQKLAIRPRQPKKLIFTRLGAHLHNIHSGTFLY